MLSALLDANLFISYLLTAGRASPPVRLIEAAIAGRFRLLLPQEVVDEILLRTAVKPYLSQRIARRDVVDVLAAIDAIAEILPRLVAAPPKVSRDRADDFLIAHAIAAGADYLVSGDKDLLVLGQVDGVRILGPAAFLAIIDGLTPAPQG